jgi:hypothetical protein
MELRKQQKARLSIERLEERDAPSQLGQVVTLPQAAGQRPETALTAPADYGHGVSVMLKIDANLSPLKY